MKNQALFSLIAKSKKLKCRLLQFLFGALRVKFSFHNAKCGLKSKILALFTLQQKCKYTNVLILLPCTLFKATVKWLKWCSILFLFS